jgi:hypothetical protein
VAGPATVFQQVISAGGWPAASLWRNLTALAADFESNRELAEISLRKTVGPQGTSGIDRLAGAITQLEEAVRQAFPQLEEELRLRLRPLQEQWESRGPGLLRGIARRTDPRILVPRAEVILVLPARGGGGVAHLASNRVRFEAVLANAIPFLPEPVRLGWLLSQVALDLPVFADAIHGERLPPVAALAMLPATLAAAVDVEWAGPRPDLMLQALQHWGWAADTAPVMADIVQNWWETFQSDPADWSVALAALDRLLADASG